MKKPLVLIFVVLALSGYWTTLGNVAGNMAFPLILDMKIPTLQKSPAPCPRCSSPPYQWVCANTLDSCNKSARDLCEADFKIVKNTVR